jgi:choline dehydrogenase
MRRRGDFPVERFDFVIVGGGSAASVLAYRLGAAGKTVCVLEAGPPDINPFIRIPAGFMKTLFNPSVTYQFHHEGSPGTNGRQIHVAQGRTLGGSSSINGMLYNRGQATAYDSWAQLGNRGWSYRDVLPYFRRTERAMDLGTDEYRGRSGRLPVAQCGWRNEVCEAFIEGAVEVGVPRNKDYNGENQAGTGYYQSFIHRNERWSAARSFLHPARKQFGVAVRTHAQATQILLEGKRAAGVRFRKKDGSFAEVFANTAVVVSAGAVNTPKLLQLSGIGPGPLLRQFGIEVRHELPGVGENFRDHFTPRIVARAKPGTDSINDRVRGLRLGREIAAWALNRPTVVGISPVQAYAYWKTDPAMIDPDFATSFAPASYAAGMIGKLDDFPGMTIGTKQLRPESRGYVRITSADDREPPVLQPNFIQNEFDQRVVVAALKFARAVLTSQPMQRFVEVETLPGPSVQTDDEWLGFARQHANCGYHLIGTAKMGQATDRMAVVDERLKMHGLDGLYVADCSIMPSIPSGNTCAVAMMIGEKCADMLLKKDEAAAPLASVA